MPRLKLMLRGVAVVVLALAGGAAGAWMVVARTAAAQPTAVTANRFTLLSAADIAGAGAPRASLQEEPDGSVALSFLDPAGQPRLTIGVPSVNEPVIALHDDRGQARAVLALSTDGTPHLVFLDKDGFLIWSAP